MSHEPRQSNVSGIIRMKDVFKSTDTNLLGDVNLSDMNVLSSNLGNSEPRQYLEEPHRYQQTDAAVGKFSSPVKEIPEQEDMEESQNEQSQAIMSEAGQHEETSENQLFLELEK